MIKIHAYQVESQPDTQSLNKLLELIAETPLENRAIHIDYHDIQIEDIRSLNGYWLFDVTKLNFGAGPGRGRIGRPTQGFRLDQDEAFAENTACLYCPQKNHILIEYKHSGARSGAVAEYLSQFNSNANNIYEFLLRLDPQTLSRVGRKSIINSFQIKVAPHRLRDVDRRSGVSLNLALSQTDHFGGQILNIEVATEPYSRGTLDVRKVRQLVDWIRRAAGRDEEAIKKADIKGKDNPESKSETIHLINQKLEQRFDGYHLDATRRYKLDDRYDALMRTYRAWNSII